LGAVALVVGVAGAGLLCACKVLFRCCRIEVVVVVRVGVMVG